MLVGRFWRVLKNWWSRIILNASYPSLKFIRLDHLGTVLGPSRDRPETGMWPSKMRIWKYVGFWDCITQGYEIEEFWRSEITGKSKSSEAMTFRYIPDMINLAFFIWKVKIKGMQLYLSSYIFILYVSSIKAWTRLKSWRVIRFVEKIMVPTGKSFFNKISTFSCSLRFKISTFSYKLLLLLASLTRSIS